RAARQKRRWPEPPSDSACVREGVSTRKPWPKCGPQAVRRQPRLCCKPPRFARRRGRRAVDSDGRATALCCRHGLPRYPDTMSRRLLLATTLLGIAGWWFSPASPRVPAVAESATGGALECPPPPAVA